MKIASRTLKIIAVVVGVCLLLYGGFRAVRLLESLLGAGAARDAAIARADSLLARSAQEQASRDSLQRALAASRSRVERLAQDSVKLKEAETQLEVKNDSLLALVDSMSLDSAATKDEQIAYWKGQTGGFKALYRNQLEVSATLRLQVANRDTIIVEKDGQILGYANQAIRDSVYIKQLLDNVAELKGFAEERCLLGLIKCPSREVVFLVGAGVGTAATLTAYATTH